MAKAAKGAAKTPFKEVTREMVEEFISSATEVTLSDKTRELLKDPSSGRPSNKIVHIQKQIWEDLGVSVENGRAAANKLAEELPDDETLKELRDKFSKAVDTAYLRALEDRRPAVLEKKAKMKRNTVLEFLDACGVRMDQPEVQARLRKEIDETGGMPENTVNEIHNEVIELLGFERDHGHQCFTTFGSSKEYAKDTDIAMSFGRWRGKTSDICLNLIRDFQREGGEVTVEAEVRGKLQELEAKEGLNKMTIEERSQLLEKHAKKVNVFRNLPPDARERHLSKLAPEERQELIQAEVMMVTIMQHRQKQAEKAE